MSFNPIIVRFKLLIMKYVQALGSTFNPIIVRFKHGQGNRHYKNRANFQSYNSSIQTCFRLAAAWILLPFNPIIVRFKPASVTGIGDGLVLSIL